MDNSLSQVRKRVRGIQLIGTMFNFAQKTIMPVIGLYSINVSIIVFSTISLGISTLTLLRTMDDRWNWQIKRGFIDVLSVDFLHKWVLNTLFFVLQGYVINGWLMFIFNLLYSVLVIPEFIIEFSLYNTNPNLCVFIHIFNASVSTVGKSFESLWFHDILTKYGISDQAMMIMPDVAERTINCMLVISLVLNGLHYFVVLSCGVIQFMLLNNNLAMDSKLIKIIENI
jgi:hypothetical protein